MFLKVFFFYNNNLFFNFNITLYKIKYITLLIDNNWQNLLDIIYNTQITYLQYMHFG